MKFKIVDKIRDLGYFNSLFNISNNIEITGELEIEPFRNFKPEFGCTYWYFQYTLLKNGRVLIGKNEIFDEYKDFFNEVDVNIVWIQIINESNYKINCIDGDWSIEFFKDTYLSIIERYGEGWVKIN